MIALLSGSAARSENAPYQLPNCLGTQSVTIRGQDRLCGLRVLCVRKMVHAEGAESAEV